MEHARSNWNDDRLDSLSAQVDSLRRHIDERFARIDERFEKQDARIDERFEKQDARIDERFDAVQERFDKLDSHLHGLKNAMIVTLAGILAGFGGAIAAIGV